jgi:hypothetical protein
MAVRTPKLRTTARKAAAKTKGAIARVPGPSTNPATNLLIIDVAMRGASMLFWRGMEKALLRARYNQEKASDIVKGRSMIQSAASTGAARLATRSVPGFLVVTGGLLAKAVFDRTLSRRESVRRGEKQFAEQAANAPEE